MWYLLTNSGYSWVMAPTIVISTWLPRFPGLHLHALTRKSSTPNHGFHLIPSIVSVSFIVPLWHCLPLFLIYVCISFLFSFTFPSPRTLTLSALPIFLINAMISDSIYKTSLHVIIWHVRILTLILIVIVYLTSLWTSELLKLSFQTSRNNPCQIPEVL